MKSICSTKILKSMRKFSWRCHVFVLVQVLPHLPGNCWKILNQHNQKSCCNEKW